MSLRRISQLITVTGFIVLWSACGQYYRPVVIPTSVTPPTPANFHAVFAVNTNVPLNPGTGMQIDVAGDTSVGTTNVGLAPTHAAIAPNNSRVFIANAGSLATGGADTVSAFTPSFGVGLGAVTTFSLPTGSLPAFVGTTQSNAAYVANFGTNSVASLNTGTNVVSNIVPVGSGPVALAETPNANRLYVANQTDGTVTSLNPLDMSQNAVILVGSQPVWIVSRNDSQRVYVITQGAGQLLTIDTASDTVIPISPVLSVGAGANFMAYDPHLNRLYVTNPANGTVYVFSATGGANDTPMPLGTVSVPGLSATACPGCGPAIPNSVAPLQDGSRFYIASYQIATPCPDPNVTASGCVIPQLTDFDATSFTAKTASILLLAPTLYPPVSTTNPQPYALAQVPSCVQSTPYTPGVTRFRVFTTAAADSSRVYVSMCDAGAVAVVNAANNHVNGGPSPDTLVVDLPSPLALCTGSCTGEPPRQNPVILVTGQ